MVADCGLGLGLEDSGLALALGLGCCWTCYKSAYKDEKYPANIVRTLPRPGEFSVSGRHHWERSPDSASSAPR